MTYNDLIEEFIVADNFSYFQFDLFKYCEVFKIDLKKINDESEGFFEFIKKVEDKLNITVRAIRVDSVDSFAKELLKWTKLLLKVRKNNKGK